jgi:hypothetical protein
VSSGILTETRQNDGKELFDADSAESKRKVAGSNGAAAKVGIPHSTLKSRLKLLKIENNKFTH